MKQNRIEYLDSLRGLASISVVLSHFVLAYRLDLEFKLLNYSPFHFFYDGFAAVTFFFVLSGYVLTLSLESKESIVLPSFYSKRIFRIMPAYIVTLLISLILYSFFKVVHTNPDSSSWINSFWDKPLDFINFAKQIVFLVPDRYAELVCQNWSLKVEMQFSFLIPFLYIIYKKTNFLFFFFLNLILYSFFSLPVYLFHFSFGISLAMNKDFILAHFVKLKNSSRTILICCILFLYTYRYTLPMYYYYFFREQSVLLNNDDLIWIISGIGSFLILLYCFTSSRLQKILNLNFFTFIGRISYAIYLTHMMVLIFVVPIVINQLNNVGIVNNYVVWFFSLIALLIITIILSYFLTTFIEVPMAKLGNSIIKKTNVSKMELIS
ncbi:acyltransferase family protein [Flavobacterium gawalongense]|uniref:Acyltransferase n=1 Tax=Flavobacterium gawalongense TaxID=2594432 RepID=A0ABY3CSL8_9FLAO|nr:acyltransferase [Flavobacterium gawalongense]TRX04457.1 acyltransferase [Flavobacterium gawalongense]TRX10347.1 acyltransferase [Flavobacterium gawalongense]